MNRRGMSEVNIVSWLAIGAFTGIAIAPVLGASAWITGPVVAVLGILTGVLGMRYSLIGESAIAFWIAVASYWMPAPWRIRTLLGLFAATWLLIAFKAIRVRRTTPPPST